MKTLGDIFKSAMNEVIKTRSKSTAVQSARVERVIEVTTDNQLKNIMHDNDKMAQAISKYPKIMERPILVKGNQAVIGRPTDNILQLIT